MLMGTNRKHRMEEERQALINHENKLLYKKMNAILLQGAGNVSPPRSNKKMAKTIQNDMRSRRDSNQETESIMLHYGRSATARPSINMMRRIAHHQQ